MQILENILYDCIYHSTPIILCVLGGIFAYKANVLNISLEGMMLNGALVSVISFFLTGNLILTVIFTLFSTLLYSLVFSFFSVTMKGNVIIVGLALNMISIAVAGFVLVMFNSPNIILPDFNLNSLKISIPIIRSIPLIRVISGHPILTYCAFILIFLIHILMFHTRFGIYVRVVGENEEAVKAIGIPGDWYKYIAILLGAIGCALGGMNLAYERLGLFTKDMVAGRGFIAIAAIYCGKGQPIQSAFYAVLFGLARSLAVNLSVYSGNIAGLFDCIPYLVMILVLSFASSLKQHKTKLRGF